MESATMLTRQETGQAWAARLLAVPAAVWAKVGFMTMTVTAAAGFVIYPTYPNYDSVYFLLWGREAVHLQALSLKAYRASTEHPLGIAFGAVLAPLGAHAERVMIAAAIASFLLLAAGLYRLGRVAFTPLVGAAAAALLLARFTLSFLAVRGYLDIPYMAILVWAAALEAERPRRGTLVFLLLLAAALLRPEAWILAGLYFLWCAWRAPWGLRLRYAALTVAGPLIWAGLDLLETGDPLFSLHSTRSLAGSFGRNTGLGSVPGVLWMDLVRLDTAPVLVGAIGGLVLAIWLVPRRIWMPFVLLLIGLGTFALDAAGGASVIDRYLLLPALMALVFCAVGLAGWTMLEPGGLLRRAWALGAILLMLYGVASAAATLSLQKLQTELGFRGDSHVALAAILRNPRVRAGLRCGPLSVPNHKLVPDARFILSRGPEGVIARSQALVEAGAGRPNLLAAIQHGVALYPTGQAVLRQALVDATDDPREQEPVAGFDRVARTQYYGAYVHC